jgi:hypothetical protein
MILFPLQPEQLHHAGLERWVRADQLEPDPKLWVPTGQSLIWVLVPKFHRYGLSEKGCTVYRIPLIHGSSRWSSPQQRRSVSRTLAAELRLVTAQAGKPTVACWVCGTEKQK